MDFEQLFRKGRMNGLIRRDEVTLGEMGLGYFLGPVFAQLSNAVFAAYLNRYYSDVIEWTDAAKYGMFSTLLPVISVLFIVIGNLYAGRRIDEIRTPQGKARPFLVLSAPIVPTAIMLLFFMPRSWPPFARMFWIAFTYNFYFAFAWPVYFTAHSALCGLSTRNAKEKGRLAALTNASAVTASGLGAAILVPVLLQHYLFADSRDGGVDVPVSYHHWRRFSLVLAAAAFAAILVEYFFTRERVTESEMGMSLRYEETLVRPGEISLDADTNKAAAGELKTPALTQRDHVRACMGNRYWRMIILFFLFYQISGVMKNGSMGYYCRWMFSQAVDEESAGALLSTVGFVGGIPTAAGFVLAWPVARRMGKRNAIMAGMLLSVAGGLICFADVHSFPVVLAGIVVKAVGTIPAMYVSMALLSEVLDYMEKMNGFRSDGFTMSIYGSIMVGASGLGTGLINRLLMLGGYDAQQLVQGPTVQKVLAFCYLGMDLFCYAAIAAAMVFLTVEKHKE